MKLYNDDCLNVLKTIPSESIDLILTDCPYHICKGGNVCEGFQGLSTRGKETKYINLHGIFEENNPLTYVKEGKLFQFNDIKFSEWLPECYRVLKERTHIYIYQC